MIEILVSVGDTVEADDGLVTLESDKATMDVPAPEAGTIDEILVEVGDKVSEGTAIAKMSGGDGGEDEASADDAEDSDADGEDDDGDEPAEDDDADEDDADEARRSRLGRRRLRRRHRGRPAADQRRADLRQPLGSPARARAGDRPEQGRGHRSQGPDHGRGRREGRDEGPPAARSAGGASIEGLNMAPWPKTDFSKYGEIERVELSRIKQISGPNLARNWVYIPHVTHQDEADITELEAFRKQINSEQDVKVTMVALLLKACVPVLKQFPEFNSSLDGDSLILKRYYHLGFAADTPQGLLVPVIRDVDKKGLLEVADELIELSGKAREGKLGPAEMAGATFTISSLGGIGGTGFTPIVNAPQVAILGVTRSAMKPVWDGEAGSSCRG